MRAKEFVSWVTLGVSGQKRLHDFTFTSDRSGCRLIDLV